jgi:NAD(P)-dependent dehydrogenase (short-subunit alcohol dehydrogenase family)
MPNAIITGGSAGLGKALAAALADRGWHVVITGRTADRLAATAHELSRTGRVAAVPGDVADPGHRRELAGSVAARGSLDLLVNNASVLGPTPLRPLIDLSPAAIDEVFAVNVTGPTELTTALLPSLRAAHGAVLNISSDAAVEHYPQWGAYGASKAALDHLTLTLAAENPDICWYAVDPGDMRTALQQAAFPGEDISDRTEPAAVVPALLALIDRRPPNGRYRAADIAAPTEIDPGPTVAPAIAASVAVPAAASDAATGR